MDIFYTTKFHGNLAELKECGALKEHSVILRRVIGSSFDGAFEDEPEEYEEMEKDIRISAEFETEHWGENIKNISVTSDWHYKDYFGSFKYQYSLYSDADPADVRESDALLIMYYKEFNTELHISPVTIHVENGTATVRKLYMAPVHEIDLCHFDGICAFNVG